VNPIDAVTLLLVLVAAILGWRSGAIPQVLGLTGAILGGAAVLYALPLFSGPLAEIDAVFRPVVVLAALIGAVALGESVGAGLGGSATRRLGNGLLGAADLTMGAGFGAVQALLIVWLAGSLLAEGPIPRLAETAGGSTAVRTLTAILPPPTEIAVGLGGWLDDTGLPDVFVGFEPLPGPPVDRPADPQARAIAAVAEASTLKVSAATCGLTSVGTGFVVAYDYVVTNAHVVAGAGARGIRVTAPGGRIVDAVPVLFDPDLDVAVLHVARLAVPPLAFAPRDPARGAVGAALGYPGGGGLTIVPAAVSAHFAATGLDIYGVSKVRRQVLELRAEIDRGDSGGPFVLTDGTVGGVVFAEAKTNQEIGYALSAREVAARIAPGLGRTAAVDTGACVRA
jgi:S1-C subfamily serine protease